MVVAGFQMSSRCIELLYLDDFVVLAELADHITQFDNMGMQSSHKAIFVRILVRERRDLAQQFEGSFVLVCI